MNLKLSWRGQGKNTTLKTEHITQHSFIVLSYPTSNIIKVTRAVFLYPVQKMFFRYRMTVAEANHVKSP
ncbi:MAG: hypothetical protein JRE16_05930 [Deltaproteobacteria bacterium]|jgi:hypothetical protein|nr:hypothetical protein [Deltaproteobacteria bacterium]MBW2521030.1 hypothetical protein [Deltaproteobacteria bacterium]